MKVSLVGLIALGLLFSSNNGTEQIRSIGPIKIHRFQDLNNTCYVTEVLPWHTLSMTCVKT